MLALGIEIELAGDAGKIAGIGAGDGLKDEQGVFDRARHGAEFVEGPAKGHGAGARDAAVGGTQAGNAATHAGADDAAAGFAADGKADESGSGGGSGAGTGTGSAFFEEPGIHGLPAEPNVVEGQSAEAEFGEKHGAGGVEAFYNGGVFFRNAIAEWFSAVGSGDVGGVEKILAAPGDAVKRAAIFTSGDFCVGLSGLGEREIAGEGDDAAELGIELLDAAQIDLCEALGGEFALFDPAGELGYRGESDVGVVGGERAGVEIGANELIALRPAGLAGENGLVAREGCECGFESDGAWTGAAFVNGSKVDAPGGGGLGAVCGG